MQAGGEERSTQSPQDVYRLYENALHLLYQKKYDKARPAFLEILRWFPQESGVVARVHSYLKVCDSRLSAPPSLPDTPDALFDLGVAHHNAGRFDRALECFSEAVKRSRNPSHHVYYAMAASEVALGNTDKALQNLRKAFEANAETRFAARNDPDFEALAQNREFQELVRSPKSGR